MKNVRIFDPSKGGMGIRLITARMIFTLIIMSKNSITAALAGGMRLGKSMAVFMMIDIIRADMRASKILERGPAKETKGMSVF